MLSSAAAFVAERRADSLTTAFGSAVRDIGLPPPPTVDLAPAARRRWRGVVVSAARTAARARRDAVFADPPPQLALLAAARSQMSSRWSRRHIIGETTGGPSSFLVVTLAGSWRGSPGVRSTMRSLHGLGPPVGRCDWCGQGHTRCGTGVVLLFCQGQAALWLRGAFLPEVR